MTGIKTKSATVKAALFKQTTKPVNLNASAFSVFALFNC